ncbi:hypothetical protein GRI34_13095 [Erythrobacter aquimaris]|uniref:Sel1 repeat family protein n=1 Tax=Qipengyuania aquimaris TaxID=255984 RepID=A0A6I4TNA2_9SPHN|nr:hypothetical protein [Qipengyuania aquimaris]MXO97352.1 hypothetical protein [Qipengyuania aquimaris]
MNKFQRFLFFLPAIALVACENAQPETKEEVVLDAIACCVPPSEDEVKEIIVSAEAGDIDAIRRVASFYTLRDDQDAESEALRWLELAASKGASADADKLVMFHLSRGECEAAQISYSRLTASVDDYPMPGGSRDESVADCFERPIGEGTWSTRRKAAS